MNQKLSAPANLNIMTKIRFLTELRDILQHTINDNNPDALWEDFKTRFLFVADVHAPQITNHYDRYVGLM